MKMCTQAIMPNAQKRTQTSRRWDSYRLVAQAAFPKTNIFDKCDSSCATEKVSSKITVRLFPRQVYLCKHSYWSTFATFFCLVIAVAFPRLAYLVTRRRTSRYVKSTHTGHFFAGQVQISHGNVRSMTLVLLVTCVTSEDSW